MMNCCDAIASHVLCESHNGDKSGAPRKRKSGDIAEMKWKPGHDNSFDSFLGYIAVKDAPSITRDAAGGSSTMSLVVFQSARQKTRMDDTKVDTKQSSSSSSKRMTRSPSISPSMFLELTLKNSNLPKRIDPLSLEQAMFFEPYQESEISIDLLQAIRSNDLQRLREVAETSNVELKDVRNEFGENLVHLACRLGLSTDILEYLVMEKNVQLNVRDRLGRSPMHNVCMAPIPVFSSVEFLIDQSAKLVLFEDDSGNTPFECIPIRSFDSWTRFMSESSILKRISCGIQQP